MFDDDDVSVIADSFANTIRERCYTCYACAIMPELVHLLIRRHRDKAEQMIAALQDASRIALVTAGRRFDWHPVWGGPGWKVFKFSRAAVVYTVRYIEGNPEERCLSRQRWPFVTPYDGWLPAG